MNYVWTEKVRSIAELALDCEGCTQSHVTAPVSHGAAKKVMAARVTRISQVYVDALDRGVLDPGLHAQSQVHSIVSLCARSHRLGLLASFSPFRTL